ncbi:endonuclease/exonuclease/phosphatase family protein [Saccharomonospora sp. CUA-673]|uniref:endonuclease/exonuclease/phosphatase family protein n=1 Tax=Saccharomonospora sp. CUA-673 TaxID=1904969 RepID=UPI00111547F6|nr:endonuclease/exonuclease/phosphatase family protein [Saccharomonospora sp. CUA-673]
MLAAGVFGASAVSAAPPDRSSLSVLSFNIHHGVGMDDELDLDRIARVIARSGADVAALQEVDRHHSERSEWRDQTRELAKRLGYHAVFGANIDRDPPEAGKPRVQYGTAILSRYPIVQWSNTYLERSPDQEQRGLLHAQLNLCGERVNVYNTHLAASSQPDRAAQAQQISELVDQTRPAVVAGDMNALPDAPELAPLRETFTDVWPVAGKGPGATFPADEPDRRIDYIYTGDDVTPTFAKVLATEPEASDHRPLLAHLTLD